MLLRHINLRAVLLTAGVLLVGMAAFQVYDVLRRLDIVLDSAEHEAGSLVRALAEQTASSLQTVDVILRETALDAGQASPGHIDQIDSRTRARILNIAQVLNVTLINADGSVVASIGSKGWLKGSQSDQPYFTRHRAQPDARLNVSGPFRLAGEGMWAVALSRRVEGRSGGFKGVVVAYVDLDYFRRLYEGIDLKPGSSVSLLNSNGEVLVSYPGSNNPSDRIFPEYLFRELLAQPQGVGRLLPASVDGDEDIYAIQAIRGFPLVIGISSDKAAVLKPWYVQATHSAVRTTLLCASVGLLLWLVVRQLRRRELAEDRLRVQTAQLDELFESAPEAIVMLDLDGRVTRINREFTRLFGYTSKEAEGGALDELIVPEDLRWESKLMAETVRRGQHPSTETERMHKDGSRRHVSALGAPIVTASGPIASYSIYRDMTERKLAEAERLKLEMRLRHAEKLEAIGTMAGGIAHDFNSVLAAMIGYANMGLSAAVEGSMVKRHIGNLLAAADRARALVDQILTYSPSTRAKRGVVHMAALVQEALELVRASLPANIELRSQLNAREATVVADATQVHQLLMNLCNNAIQAMGAGGQLNVMLDAVTTAVDRALSHGLLIAGRYVHLAVEDTGSGIDAAIVAHIFAPFFTTKESGLGTGLGLALVHGIVTELGGAIHVTTGPGKGSTFDLYLPRSDAPQLGMADDKTPLPRGNGEHILLVEDEQALMLLAEEMLAALNYEPSGFTRTADALSEFRADPFRFDAVFLDYLMPGITGIELARNLHAARSDIPIVMISGYTGPALAREAVAVGVGQILTKPLDFRQLAEAMAKALNHAQH